MQWIKSYTAGFLRSMKITLLRNSLPLKDDQKKLGRDDAAALAAV